MTDRPIQQRLRDRFESARIGSGELFEGLASLDGIGSIAVADGVAEVEITLPVPSDRIRSTIEEEIESEATAFEEVRETTCHWRPEASDSGERVDLIPDVKNLVAVTSGKGGVGKSTVSINLAVALADAGLSVGLLDADVYGPNAPTMLGLSKRSPSTTLEDEIVPREAHGVQVMSMDFIVDEDDPVIWRGPMVDDFITQMVDDVHWGELDYLIVDLPPGTGDAQLTIAQHLPLAGAIIVTTPQPVAIDDARRGLEGFARYGVPILGLAENMSGFTCPDCGSVHDIFDSGGANELAASFDVPVLGNIPIDSSVGTFTDDEQNAPPGIDIPLVGRLQLPQTQEEREEESTVPPVAVRETETETQRAVRELATRTVARVASYHHGTGTGQVDVQSGSSAS